ncbi:MAG: hypothetical protein ACHQE6_07940 [Solirubrobacterales bacterium]
MAVIEKLVEFCIALDERRAHYEVLVTRPEAVMVTLTVPGERWEIEFFHDGHMEIERFVSQGVFDAGPDVLDKALRYFDDVP